MFPVSTVEGRGGIRTSVWLHMCVYSFLIFKMTFLMKIYLLKWNWEPVAKAQAPHALIALPSIAVSAQACLYLHMQRAGPVEPSLCASAN